MQIENELTILLNPTEINFHSDSISNFLLKLRLSHELSNGYRIVNNNNVLRGQCCAANEVRIENADVRESGRCEV